MNSTTKKSIAAIVILALFAILQWVSGLPFERSPNESFFLVAALVFAGIAATYPGFDA